MKTIIGHPTGTPFAFNAALSYHERDQLAEFVVPWLPSKAELDWIGRIPGMSRYSDRFSRRRFEPLRSAPLHQGRMKEALRLSRRVIFERLRNDEELRKVSRSANRWIMQELARRSSPADAIHSYEDCALDAFVAGRQKGKVCVYDLPIAYFRSWDLVVAELHQRFKDWFPSNVLQMTSELDSKVKSREMELADLVLAPSTFVKNSVLSFHPDKKVEICQFGVDLDKYVPAPRQLRETVKFLYAGHLSIRKGVPLLLEAWDQVGPKNAELILAGTWQLADAKRDSLPRGVTYRGHLSQSQLIAEYQSADVFVFPSYFEGYGLVISEAMAAGLPVLCSDATAGPDLLDESSGKIFSSGDIEALIEGIRWFASHQSELSKMGEAARARIEKVSWAAYRSQVANAVQEL